MERDISQRLEARFSLTALATGNGVINGDAIDTQAVQTGLAFFFAATAYNDGSHVISFEKADDLAFSVNVAAIPSDQIVVDDVADLTIAAATANGDVLSKAGLLSLKAETFQDSRFIRAVVTSTGVSSGATIIGFTVAHLDDAP